MDRLGSRVVCLYTLFMFFVFFLWFFLSFILSFVVGWLGRRNGGEGGVMAVTCMHLCGGIFV